MKTLTQKLTRELACRSDLVSIPALVEDYGVEAKAALWEMKKAGLVRLVQVGDYSDWTAEEIANMVRIDLGGGAYADYSGAELAA